MKTTYLKVLGCAILIVGCSKELPDEIEEDNSNLEAIEATASSSCPNASADSPQFGMKVCAGDGSNLTKYRQPYDFELPINPQTGFVYRSSDIVGMATDGHPNLHFVWYKNGRYSAGTSEDLSASRSPFNHTYQLPSNPITNYQYQPDDIVGMAIDGTNNWVFAWYNDSYVSAGTPSNLGAHRDPYHYDLAIDSRNGKEFKPNQIKGIAIDGQENVTVVFYQYRQVSMGTTAELDKYSKSGSTSTYCLTKLPGSNVKPKHFIDAGIDYTNNHVFIWFDRP